MIDSHTHRRERRTAWLLAALAAFVSLAATGCARTTTPPPSGATSIASSSTVPATAPVAEQPADLAHLQISLTPMWRGFDRPLNLVNAGDGSGRLFVVEQRGIIKVIANGSVQPQPYLDVSSLTAPGGERGLLGLAFSPGFKTNGRIYVNYTDLQGNTNIVRYTTTDPTSNAPSWGTPQQIFYAVQPYANHNGGNLVFGPDGMLYFGMGDGGSAGDPQRRAQNTKSYFGKILRVDTGDAPGGTSRPAKYDVPPGNPFANDPAYLPEIWMLGVRNPWRFSFDAETKAMWIGDVGQDAWEEIDYAPPGSSGQNWGWNLWEGNHPYPPGSNPSRSGFTFPLLDYPHPTGECVTGGYVYRGSAQPALVGTYVYGDYIKGWLGGVRLDAPDGTQLAAPETRTLLQTQTQPSSFGVDEQGELYLVDYAGSVWRVDATKK